MIKVKAIRLRNVRIDGLNGLYVLLNGWTVINEAGEVYAPKGKPWFPIGGCGAANAVAQTGLLPNAEFFAI